MTKLFWDPSYGLPQLALERTSSDALLRRYVYGSDLVSMTTSAGSFFAHEDGLGSVQNVTNASGVKQWTYVYEPFGLKRSETKSSNKAPLNPMQFTGEYLDATPGFYHLRARQYDPAVGRFTAIDPLPPLTSRPYISGYAYADQRPTALIDPSGLGAVTPNGPPIRSCAGWKNELRCLRDWSGVEEAGRVITGTIQEVPNTLDAFAQGDPNCWASLTSYWAAGLTLLGGWRVAQMAAAQSKPVGLLAEASHAQGAGQTFVAKAAIGFSFGGFGLHQSARCGR